MRIKQLKPILVQAFKMGARVLIKGNSGIGKTDLVHECVKEINADLMTDYAALAEPIDYRGMPALTNCGNEAHFLPFGNLNKLIKAERPLICFFDEIGQSSIATQSALMGLILARHVNGTEISKHVTFCAATNLENTMSGVSGLIEPLKSRFQSILTLDTDIEDWTEWAYKHDIDARLVAFLNFRHDLLSQFKPTKAITNSANPRNWASLNKWLTNGIENLEVFQGAVGEGPATEFMSFLKVFTTLPPINDILTKPSTTKLPTENSAKFAVASALSRHANAGNIGAIITYLSRINKEIEVIGVKMAHRATKNTKDEITKSKDFISWGVANKDVVMG
jgi:hypothetical protein